MNPDRYISTGYIPVTHSHQSNLSDIHIIDGNREKAFNILNKIN